MLSHWEAAPRSWRRAWRSHVAGALSQQRRGVQRPRPAPLPPATEPLFEHAQLDPAVAPRRQPPGSTVRVFRAVLEAGLAAVPRVGGGEPLSRSQLAVVDSGGLSPGIFREVCEQASAVGQAWRRADSAVYERLFRLATMKTLKDLSGAGL